VNQQLVPTIDGEGRVVAAEILVATPAVRALIRANKVSMIVSAMQTGAIEGMRTMDASLAEVVRTGRVTRQAALERCHDEAELLRMI
jgi:twitching motility protein PilT